MTHIDIRPTDRPATGTRSARARKVAVLVIQVALAVQFIAGGASKLLGSEQMVTLFDDIGAGTGSGRWSASWRSPVESAC